MIEPADARPRQDRTIKLLLAVIAVALTLIALRPFLTPLPAQAQTTAGVASGTSIIMSDKVPYDGQTALVSYKSIDGRPLVSVLVYRGGKWSVSDSIIL